MDATKPWYLSKTVLASLATLAVSVMTETGWIDAGTAASITAVLTGLGIYGRAVATKSITAI
jgi:hypothetical protein